MCKCNCCKRGPQGIQGVIGPEGPQGPQGDPGPVGPSIENVVTQNNIDVTFPMTDANDESILLSNGNRLMYLTNTTGRFRVSLQFKINNSSLTTHTVNLFPTIAIGGQTTSVGAPINYLSTSPTYTVSALSNFYEVFEFDVFLDAGESIALAASTSGGVGEVALRDNLFLIDKIA